MEYELTPDRLEILQELYLWSGAQRALYGSDPGDSVTPAFDQWARLYRANSTEQLQEHLSETKIHIRKVLAERKLETRLPWPQAGVKVWTPFLHAHKTIPCSACEGNAVIKVGKAVYRCTSCGGNGTRMVSDTNIIEATVVKATYVQSGGHEGWGDVRPLALNDVTLFWVSPEGQRYVSESSDGQVFQSREDCEAHIAKGRENDWPRWRRS